MAITAAPWWVLPGLEIEDGRLQIAGRDAEQAPSSTHCLRPTGTARFLDR